MKYKIEVSVWIGDSYRSAAWEEDLSRNDVKNFIMLSGKSFGIMIPITPPEAADFLDGNESLTEDEIAELDEEIQNQVDNFCLEVIIPDSLRFWTEDLTEEYTRLSHGMPTEKLSGYEARYNEIKSMTNKEEAVRKLYSLVEEMKS